MALLNQDQIEKVEMLCGYTTISNTVRTQLTTEFTQVIIDRVSEIISELASIDEYLKEALSTSFVTEARGSKLNYKSHVAHLKSEAVRLLKELANLLSIDVAFNKYQTNKTSTISYW